MGDTKFSNPLIPRTSGTLSHADLQHEKLKSMEDELLENALTVVGGVCNFAHLDPEDLDKVPEGWDARTHRMAKVGWVPNKEAPVAVHTSTKVLTGIIRARATEKAGPRSLNINMVSMTAPPRKFETVDLIEEE